MMNQEEYVDVHALMLEGWTAVEIAEVTGFHPATIRKRLKQGPPVKVEVPDERRVLTAAWRCRIETLLGTYPRLLAVSVHHKLRVEGFAGSYPTVVRAVRDVRVLASEPRRRCRCRSTPTVVRRTSSTSATSMTSPLGGVGIIRCAASGRSRAGHDNGCGGSPPLRTTFEGLARTFEAFGGVPAAARTDRTGALGSSQGRRFKLHPAAVAFAAHYGVKITSCQAGDAKRKGKVERPFRQLRETFLPEVELDGIPADIAELNRRAQAWLDSRVHAVPSRTTGVAPAQRAGLERAFRARRASRPNPLRR